MLTSSFTPLCRALLLFTFTLTIAHTTAFRSSFDSLTNYHNATQHHLPSIANHGGDYNLTVVQLNVYLRPPFIHTGPAGDFKRIRFEKLKSLFEQQIAHVWVLAECFEPWASRVIDAAHQAGYPYVRQGPADWANWQKPVGSGLLIVSKLPLENTEKVVFQNAVPTSADYWAQKGFIYTQVQLPGNDSIHLVRNAQFQQISDYLKIKTNKANDPAQRAVMVVGDLNVDAIDSQKDYQSMIDAFGFTDVVFDALKKHPVTYAERDSLGKRIECVISDRDETAKEESLDYTLFDKGKSQWRPVNVTVESFPIKQNEIPMSNWEAMWHRVYHLYPTQISDHNGIKIVYQKSA